MRMFQVCEHILTSPHNLKVLSETLRPPVVTGQVGVWGSGARRVSECPHKDGATRLRVF